MQGKDSQMRALPLHGRVYQAKQMLCAMPPGHQVAPHSTPPIPLRPHLLARHQDAVAAGVAAVQHLDVLGLGVPVQEEGVPNHVQLLHSILN